MPREKAGERQNGVEVATGGWQGRRDEEGDEEDMDQSYCGQVAVELGLQGSDDCRQAQKDVAS